MPMQDSAYEIVGTLYYTTDATNGPMHAVSSDGTDLGTMHANVQGLAEPSLLLHEDATGDDVRWFLQVEIADGVNQLFAVSANGQRARLVTDTTLEVGGRGGSHAYPRWADDDGLVGFCAVRRDPNIHPDDYTYPDPDIIDAQTGQYVLAINPSTMTPLGQPTFVPLPSYIHGAPIYQTDANGDLVYDENGDPILLGYEGDMRDGARNLVSDVSSTGLSIVYQSYVAYKGTWRADASDWTDRTALLSGSFLYYPRWSPDEAWICGFTERGIEVMASNGGGLPTNPIVSDPEDTRKTAVKVDRAFWSPSGTHLAYRVVKTSIRTGAKTHEIHTVELDTETTSYFCDGYIRGWR